MISYGTEQIHDINEICSAISRHMKGSNPYALFHFRVTPTGVQNASTPPAYIRFEMM